MAFTGLINYNREVMLDCRVLTTEEEVRAIARDWHDLYLRVGENPYADYSSFNVWWETTARLKKTTLYIVTGWKEGRLVALLPMVICVKRGFRTLCLVCYDVFPGVMELMEDSSYQEEMWSVIHRCTQYDVALIGYIEEGSAKQKIIEGFPCARKFDNSLVTALRFEGRSSEEWLRGLRRKRRAEFTRKERNMEERCNTTFTVYRDHVPQEIVAAFVQHKKAWCEKNEVKSSLFLSPDFLPRLIEDAAARGNLYFFCLRCGGHPVGFMFGEAQGKILYAYMLSYDLAWSVTSPGIVMALKTIRWVADNGFEELNLMEGKERFKEDFTNVRQPLINYVFCRNPWGWIGRFLLLTQERLRRIKKALQESAKP
jgi:CelD/BcsL family acetyltransferase involved in cellulose biosynthesis